MQEYFEVRSGTLLVLSIFLTGFLISLLSIECYNKGAIFVIDGKSVSEEPNISTTIKIGNERTLRIFLVQVFSNLSWKLLINESLQLHEVENNKTTFLIKANNEKNLEIFINEKKYLVIAKVEEIKQSSFLLFVVHDPDSFVGKQ